MDYHYGVRCMHAQWRSQAANLPSLFNLHPFLQPNHTTEIAYSGISAMCVSNEFNEDPNSLVYLITENVFHII